MQSQRIVHFITQSPGGSLFDVLETQAKLPSAKSRELFALGSLYLNKVRMTDPETQLQPGDYLRIHSEPRRYQKPPSLSERFLLETKDWWVIDKPSGVSCHATVDNDAEHLLAWLREDLKMNFYITHRLDVPTSGCLVLGKTTESVGKFNNLMIKNRVHKQYETLVEGSWTQTGLLTHWMKKDNWAPREVYSEEQPDTLRCDLEILSAEPLREFTKLRLRLLTGRTHQIRAQMKHLGHPVLNDEMYGAIKIKPQENIALRACHLQIHVSPDEFHQIEAPTDWNSWLENGSHPFNPKSPNDTQSHR